MNMRWRLKSCLRENVSLLASGALPAAEQSRVRDHLAHCADCRQYFEEIASLSSDLRQWATEGQAVEASAACRNRWTQSIQSAAVPKRSWLLTLISRWGEWFWPSPLAWGALAAVWLCLLFLQRTELAQHATQPDMAINQSKAAEVTFAQRQRELSSLIDSLAPAPAPSVSDQPRPRSERHGQSAKT